MGFIKRFDTFGESVPQFNIQGQTTIKTSMGSLASILILMLTVMFGILKLEHLVLRKNPSLIISPKDLNEDDFNDKYNTAENNFMMAFAAEDFLTGRSLGDPRYIKWYVSFYNSTFFEFNEMHPCTDSEFA